MSWISDELETRCGRESHHQAEGVLGTPDGVGDQRSQRQVVVEKATTLQKGPPVEFGDPMVTRCGRGSLRSTEWASGPPVEQQFRRTRTTHGYVWRGW